MAIQRRTRTAPAAQAAAATTGDPLADTTPSNNPLAGLGLGNIPAPTVDTAAPTPAANPLAGLMGSTLTSAPPTPVAGLDALKGSVDASVVKASLGLTGGAGPDPIILQALQDIQLKLANINLDELATKVHVQQLHKRFEDSQAHLCILEKTIMARGDVLKEMHTTLQQAVAEPAEEAPAVNEVAVVEHKPLTPEHKPSMLSIEIIQALVPMLQAQRKSVPQFALNWKLQAATIFPALAQAVSQQLKKEISAGAVEFAFHEFSKLDEASGLIVF